MNTLTAAEPLPRPRSLTRPRGGWQVIRRLLAVAWRGHGQSATRRLARFCPICGYQGMVVSAGHPPRPDARCPACGSRERHRRAHLWATEGGGDRPAGKRILHFAPEMAVRHRMRGGIEVLSVLVNASRQATYENPATTDPVGREAHFSTRDHKRYCGLDFADRVAEAGFAVETFRLPPELEPRYGLQRAEWL